MTSRHHTALTRATLAVLLSVLVGALAILGAS